MDLVGLPGETVETRVLAENDRGGDGVFETTRSQGCEAEMIRDGQWDVNQYLGSHPLQVGGAFGDLRPRVDREAGEAMCYSPRSLLLQASERTPAIMRGCSITPLDDRLIIRYASFREGYVCEACDGTGASGETCPDCFGMKVRVYETGRAAKECTSCRYPGADRMEPKATGKQRCEVCAGSGLKNSKIAIPDASQQDHSFGDIVSAGASVYDLAVGDRVIFSKLAGIYMKSGESDKYGKEINYCLLRRGEVMGLMVKR